MDWPGRRKCTPHLRIVDDVRKLRVCDAVVLQWSSLLTRFRASPTRMDQDLTQAKQPSQYAGFTG